MNVNSGVVLDAEIPPLTAEGKLAAEGESRNCRYCGSWGLVIVDSRYADARVRTCAATCECLAGRWHREWHRVHNSRMLDRLPALADVRRGMHREWTFDDGKGV